MIRSILRFPWGRLACVSGALLSFLALLDGDDALAKAVAFAAFMATGAALHGLAIWRDKA